MKITAIILPAFIVLSLALCLPRALAAESGGVLFKVERDDLVGYGGADGGWAFPPQFSTGGEFIDGGAIVVLGGKTTDPFYWDINRWAGGKWGMAGPDGKMIAECRYDQVWPFNDGMAEFLLKGKYGYFDSTGFEAVPARYESGGMFSEGLAAVQEDGKWGFIDKTGKWAVEPHFEYAVYFSDGLAGVKYRGKGGFIDRSGNIVIPCDYDGVFYFLDGIARVYANGKYGYIKKDGSWLAGPKFQKAGDFHEGMARVSDGSAWGYIDKTGKLVCGFTYAEAYDFADGMGRVGNASYRYGYVNKSGKLAIPLKYGQAGDFHFGAACVDELKASGFDPYFIDKKGRKTWEHIELYGRFYSGIPYIKLDVGQRIFSAIIATNGRVIAFNAGGKLENYSEGRYVMHRWVNKPKPQQTRDYCALFSTNGKQLCGFDYGYIYAMSDGMAAVNLGNKYGFIDAEGRLAIPMVYDAVYAFRGGLCSVKSNSRYGLIDKTGAWVVQPEYDYIEPYSGGLALYGMKDRNWNYQYGYLDKKGQIVIEAEYPIAWPFSEGLARVTIGGKDSRRYGFIDGDGIFKIKPVFTGAGNFCEGLAYAAVDDPDHPGKSICGYIGAGGNWVIKPRYDAANDFLDGCAWVKKGGAYMLIDKTGAVLLTLDKKMFPYDPYCRCGLTCVAFKDPLYPEKDTPAVMGFMDKKGNWAIEPIFDIMTCGFRDGVAVMELAEKGYAILSTNWQVAFMNVTSTKYGH